MQTQLMMTLLNQTLEGEESLFYLELKIKRYWLISPDL